jgi:hypothetical protein
MKSEVIAMEIKRTLDIMDEGKKIIMDNLGTR